MRVVGIVSYRTRVAIALPNQHAIQCLTKRGWTTATSRCAIMISRNSNLKLRLDARRR